MPGLLPINLATPKTIKWPLVLVNLDILNLNQFQPQPILKVLNLALTSVMSINVHISIPKNHVFDNNCNAVLLDILYFTPPLSYSDMRLNFDFTTNLYIYRFSFGELCISRLTAKQASNNRKSCMKTSSHDFPDMLTACMATINALKRGTIKLKSNQNKHYHQHKINSHNKLHL